MKKIGCKAGWMLLRRLECDRGSVDVVSTRDDVTEDASSLFARRMGCAEHLREEVGRALDVAIEGQGFFVVGFDCKRYLSSFTDGEATLAPGDVPRDYQTLVDYARGGRSAPVLLVGVSEGAGLSVLAAADPGLQPSLLGVLGLGLPDVNELGWRFSDSTIYFTHKTPNEPTFKAGDYVAKLGTVPLFAIHARHDEFVPVADVQRLMSLPGDGPRKLVVLEAADHRFSDKQPELQKAIQDAFAWMKSSPR
jgi:dienelactone hydrolase